MNRCKDCKYWGPWGHWPEPAKTQECAKVGNDILMPNPDSYFEILASADDDSNLQATLRTGPEFGCIQFEPKDHKPT